MFKMCIRTQIGIVSVDLWILTRRLSFLFSISPLSSLSLRRPFFVFF